MDLKIGTYEETMARIGTREYRRWMAWYELEARDYKNAQENTEGE
jgi:hypothetical protein